MRLNIIILVAVPLEKVIVIFNCIPQQHLRNENIRQRPPLHGKFSGERLAESGCFFAENRLHPEVIR